MNNTISKNNELVDLLKNIKQVSCELTLISNSKIVTEKLDVVKKKCNALQEQYIKKMINSF